MNNQGTTLVELIVSLLVLTIIVVPLLNGFVIAQKANAKSKNQMYAEKAAENIMEAVKAVGPDESANSIEAVGTALGRTVSNAAVGLGWIYDYGEGTDTYDVRLTVSASGYSSGLNDYTFATMSAFSDEKSVMIFPGISGLDFDDTAVNAFYEDHANWMMAMWQKNYSDAYDTFLSRHTEWEKNPSSFTAEPQFEPLEQDDFPTMSLDDIKRRIVRTITVEIEEDEAENSTVDNRKYTYTLKSIVKYEFDNVYSVPKAGSIGACTDYNQKTVIKEYTGYCNDSKHDGINSVYLMYEPFRSGLSTDRVNMTDSEGITSMKEGEQVSIAYTHAHEGSVIMPLSAFIVVQNKSGISLASEAALTVKMLGTGTSKIDLFSQVEINVSGTRNSVNKSIVEKEKTLDRIFTVTVDVFEQNSDHTHNAGEIPITSLSSTILQQPVNK